jgi:hypothetical protein
MGWSGMDWINVAQDRDYEHGNEPSGSIKWWEVLEWLLLRKGSAP